MQTFDIKKTIQDSLSLIKKNFFNYIIVIISVETLGLLIVNEFSKRIFNIALLSLGIEGITNNNYMVIFKRPLFLLILLLLISIAAIFILLQLIITTYYTGSGYKHEKVSLKKPFLLLKKIKPLHLFLLVLYIFIIMPNGNLGITSGITSKIHLPRFIVDAFFQNTLYTIIYISGIALSFYLNLRLFYTLAIFTNEDLSLFQAMKKSWALTKNNVFKILLLTILISIASFLIILMIYGLNYLLFSLFNLIIPKYSNVTRLILQGIFIFFYSLILSFSTILIIQVTIVSYYQISDKTIIPKSISFKSPVRRKITISASLFFFLITTLLLIINQPNPALAGDINVVAHRGESEIAIENTLESLRISNLYKPDYVEIDIQQTKDEKIIVFHDYTLQRLAGINKRINTLTWDELSKITLKNNGLTSRIPLLYEYLLVAKELNQEIMIEIKTSPFDSSNFIDDLMKIVSELEVNDMVIFQSLDLDIILSLKDKYPETVVGYIIGFNLGGIKNYNIDFYSIESFSLSTQVLSDLSRYNKAVFIWTVNDIEKMRLYLNTNINGIITDDYQSLITIKKDLETPRFSDIFWNLSFKFSI